MILKEIAERCSVRSYSDKELPNEVIENILEAGRLAPSWMNVQPWHFIVVKEARNKALLSQLSHGQPHVENAQAVILCCGDKDVWESGPFKKNLEAKKGLDPERLKMLLKQPAFNPKLLGEDAVIYRTIEEVTYAIAYMTLEAHANGVGCCVIGALGNELTESVPEVYGLARNTFEIPENTMILAMLTLGYPADPENKPPKTRKPFDEVVSWGFYGNTKH